MKKLLLFLMAALMVCQTSFAAKGMWMKPLVELDFYSLNDFRGQITESANEPGALGLAGAVKGMRKDPGIKTFLGGGNNLSGSDANDLRLGAPTILMLNSMEITANVPGAKDFSYDRNTILNQAGTSYFANLAANILTEDGNVAAPYKPYLLFMRGNARIGLIGLVGEKAAGPAAAKGYRVVPAARVAQQCVNELRQNGANIVLLLTSLDGQGQGDEKVTGEIARLLDKVEGVDGVFLSGTAAPVNGTYKKIPVVSGAPDGRGLGQIHFLYDQIKNSVLVGVARQVDVMALPVEKDKNLEKAFKRLLGGGKLSTVSMAQPRKAKKSKTSIYRDVPERAPEMAPAGADTNVAASGGTVENRNVTNVVVTGKGEKLAENMTELTNYPGGQSTLGEFFTDMLRKAYKADVVLYPGSAFRYTLAAGPVTEGMLESVMPGNDRIVIGQLTGAQIKAVLEHGMNPEIGLIRFSGLNVKASLSKPEGSRIGSVTLENGESLNNNRLYTVIICSSMQEGQDGYDLSGLQNAADRGSQLDFFKFTLKAFRTIDYNGDERLRL